MKKKALSLIIISFVVLAVFNLICFVIPAPEGYVKYDSSFWIGYSCITISFIVQIVCSFITLHQKTLTKTFYRFSLLTISYTGLIIMLIAGVAVMIIPNLPWWIGVIVCAIVLMFTIAALIKTSAAASLVEQVDEKVAAGTSFIRTMTAEAKALMDTAKNEKAKTSCKEVYEKFRYSDPMSKEALRGIENQIWQRYSDFSKAIYKDDENAYVSAAEDVINLLGERNMQCKAMK